MRLALGAVERDPLADRIDRGILVENEIEAARGRAPDRRLARGRDPERRMRLLRGRRLDHDVLEPPEPAAMGEPRARQPRPGDDLDRLLEARVGFLRRDLETVELAVPVALADAEIEPAARDEIERRGLLGQQHRVVPRQHDDGRTDAQAWSCASPAQVSSISVAETWFQPVK